MAVTAESVGEGLAEGYVLEVLTETFRELKGLGRNSQIYRGLSAERAQQLQVHARNLGFGTKCLGSHPRYIITSGEDSYAVEITDRGRNLEDA